MQTTRILLSRPLVERDDGQPLQQPEDPLLRALHRTGAGVMNFPMQSLLLYSKPPAAQRSSITDIHCYDNILVTSKAAARQLVDYLDQYWPQTPVGLPLMALGSGTAEALRPLSQRIVLPQAGHSSEHLLALATLQNVTHRRILLVKGEGGRSTLADTLGARGAKVDTLLCYERKNVEHPTAELEQLERFDPTHVVALSLETLQALLALKRPKLTHASFFVPSERVAEPLRDAHVKYKVTDDLRPTNMIKLLGLESEAGT
ncbi:uroporphyrinogen-III synthase [Allohahella marinimesophila]|uniref:Uroporphyrinogen-III synthase n=1 Tax=Allohahella marinimesophila TaxID=1054972 RepID=A0ABP7P762_9GAMM